VLIISIVWRTQLVFVILGAKKQTGTASMSLSLYCLTGEDGAEARGTCTVRCFTAVAVLVHV
jgi:hypothetical protein